MGQQLVSAQVAGPILTPASTASAAGLRAPHGTAPTSPVNGDVWTTTAGIYVQINGATVGPLSAGGGGLRKQTLFTQFPGSESMGYTDVRDAYYADVAQTVSYFVRNLSSGGSVLLNKLAANNSISTIINGAVNGNTGSVSLLAGETIIAACNDVNTRFAVNIVQTA